MSDNESLRDTFASGPHTDSASDRSRNPPCQDFLRKNLTLTDADREVLNRAASHWMHLHPGVAWEGDLGDAMAAAVAEITSLREEVAKLRMTDSEREAMEKFAFDRPMDRATAAQTAATLRNLLARLGGGQ